MMEITLYKSEREPFDIEIDTGLDCEAPPHPWPLLRLRAGQHRIKFYNFRREEAQELVRALSGHWPELFAGWEEPIDKLREDGHWKEAYKAATSVREIAASEEPLEANRLQLRMLVEWLLNRLDAMGEYLVPFEPEGDDKDIDWLAMPKDMLRLKKKQCNEEGSEDNGE